MTSTPAQGQEQLFDIWLAGHHHNLRDGLSRFLDPRAGLREASTLHSRHVGVLSALDSRLDTQAGLAAILPPPPPVAPLGTAAAIAAADPAVRMALRRHPVILSVILADLTVRALVTACEPSADPGRALVVGIALLRDRALTVALARALAPDRGLGRALARALDRAVDRDRPRARVCALAGALDLAAVRLRALDRDFHHDRTSALDHARDLAAALALALELAGSLDHDLARDIDLLSALARARKVANQSALVVSRDLGIGQTEGFAAALLGGALDDFTHADLTSADLIGRDLTGVRWSDRGTRWPPGTDVRALRARSQETARATGVYLITSPTGGSEILRHASA